MLAYVFSHRPADGVERAGYEEALRRFHAALASASPAGFVASATYRIGEGYSDWYLIESSAALDDLNAAAVSGARSAPHDEAARMAVDGAGKLLSLLAGAPTAGSGFEFRFAKPAGTGYADLYSQLQPSTTGRGVSLWRRMMTLGPPPEFCLVASEPLDLPAVLHAEVLRREVI